MVEHKRPGETIDVGETSYDECGWSEVGGSDGEYKRIRVRGLSKPNKIKDRYWIEE